MPGPVGAAADPERADADALTALLARDNPAPYAGTVRLPAHGVEIATASPELFLRRDGRTVESGPIKGTGRTAADLLEKDHAENVMIVDLVRNDLGRVCATGSVTVPDLCAVEEHPGLVHLVSTVRGELADHAGWPELLAGTFPPGSVTGAPKSSALRIIAALETAPRGRYCGAVGWVEADRSTAQLAVGIRTFWIDRTAVGGPSLRFGTGAGITWGSDPEREWAETQLKARRLLGVASGGYRPSPGLARRLLTALPAGSCLAAFVVFWGVLNDSPGGPLHPGDGRPVYRTHPRSAPGSAHHPRAHRRGSHRICRRRGHEKYDGDFELRIGPCAPSDGTEADHSQQSPQPTQSTSTSAP
ncbi:UNVERIFIED_CONTAM: hypothetical protein RKD50_009493 [Streptomyces canus]